MQSGMRAVRGDLQRSRPRTRPAPPKKAAAVVSMPALCALPIGAKPLGSAVMKVLITDVITAATPRLFKKFNFRLVWADKSKGPASLGVANYAYGPD